MKEAMEGQMRNEFEMKFQAEKEELVLHLEQKFNDEKEILKSDMETALQSKLEEKLMTDGTLQQPEVLFHVVDNTQGYLEESSIIKFAEAETTINIGNSVDLNTGIFSATTSGVFFFTFSSTTSSRKAGTTGVEILKNGVRFNLIYDNNGNNKYNNLNSSWMMSLQEGDEVKLKVWDGELFANENINLIWTGHLLKANL